MWRTALRASRLCVKLTGPTCGHVRPPLLLLPPPLAVGQLCVRREYSSQQPVKLMKVIGIPNPFIWLRTKVYSYLIRTFLDKDFTMKEFRVGAQQAFVTVSKMLSQSKFDELENLVTKEVQEGLQETFSNLSDNFKKALAAESDKIIHISPAHVEIYYSANGDKFLTILMRFWYLKDVDLLGDDTKATMVYNLGAGTLDRKDKQCILTANYEFRRDFKKEEKSDWIISHLEHSEL